MPNANNKKSLNIPIWLLIVFATLVRVLAAQLNASYQNDVLTFQIWAADLYEKGLSHFYGEGFTDYPPVYMYVLYMVGMIRSLLGLAYQSNAYNMLIRLPAFVCDIAAGYFIYKLAVKKINKNALLLAAAYLLNPAVILDSAVWGQVDAVYTLMLLASLYYISNKRLTPAYLIFGAAILTKPQSLFIAPIYLHSAYIYMNENHYSTHAFGRLAVRILAAAFFMLLLAIPFTHHFDFSPIFKQYYATLDSYAYGSVNAYNFFALIGGNWMPLSTKFLGIPYSAIGFIFIVIIVIAAFTALHKDKNGDSMFLIAAALNILTFMFSIKMHERYLFPALAFLLVAFMYNRGKQVLWLYAAFSAAFFANCADVLRMLHNGNRLSVIATTQPVISLINLLLTIFMVYVIVMCIKRSNSENSTIDDTWEVSASLKNGFLRIKANPLSKDAQVPDDLFENELAESVNTFNPPPKMKKSDYILLMLLIVVYSAIAFFNLGETKAPQTTWSPKQGELAIIDLGKVTDISRFQFMMGARHDKPFMFYASKDGQNWEYDREIHEANVFAWTEYTLDIQARYIEVIPFGDGLMMQEIALRDYNDTLIPVSYVSPEAAALTDEQYLVPEAANFMNGTYFDEIYHARTGYEFVHGLPVYENTHPPLGKDLIALSVKILGMTPFAWRLPGTLFGIFMIPLLYMFARYLLHSNHWAFFAAFIYTFDFMHFTQTRIATIDTYVTFFVIAMYMFMYLYTVFPRRSLPRSLGLLLLSGLCMGLAIASKWQGIYGAIGLPLLFFPAWYGLYQENKKEAYITAAACVAFFILIPALVYGLAYIPFVHSSGGGGIRTIIDNQRHMFWYHSTLVSEHAFSSRWWEWPLILRPIYYYANVLSDTIRQGISSFGNPAVWWGGIVATIYAIYALCRRSVRRDYTLAFLLVAYGAQYLPWILVSRTTYIYHYFPSVPFVVILLAYCFKKISVRHSIRWAYGYAALAAALFALFYPVLSGLPFSVSFVHTFLRWLPGWVLM